MKKKIYAVLLLTAVCAGSGVFAQSSAPKENLEKYYTLERIRSKSGWLVSDNAAGLMLNQASLSIAEVNYDFEQGGLRNVTDGAEVNAFGVRSESYRRWNRLSLYGKLSYDYPMLLGDSIPGNTRDETYAIEAGVAYRMGRWVVGAMGKYEDRSLAKRRDSRNKTTSMYLSVQPGVMFTSKVVDAGLNFTYERSTEQVGYAAFGTNTTSGMIYFFEGMWFYTSQQLGGSEKFYDVYYKGSEYGGAAQLELKLGKRVKFFNQFSAEYGKMERFRFDLDQHLGDNDQLTYRYLGVLNVAGRGVDQRLSVDASWGDLLKYNNIQELELDPETNQKLYKQYGRFLKFSQKQRSVDADYKLYVKRNEWSSSWIVDAAYTYYKAESEYTISPACYDQDLHYSKLMLGVTKNFRFSGRSWLAPLATTLAAGVWNVTFEPACRNNWHVHTAESGGGQILVCVAGRGWYHEDGKNAQPLHPGDVVSIPAGVKHWHGAARNSWFSHLAIEVPGVGTGNEWLEPVDAAEYDALA